MGVDEARAREEERQLLIDAYQKSLVDDEKAHAARCVEMAASAKANRANDLLEKKRVPRRRLQLVGITSLLIAAKFEEI